MALRCHVHTEVPSVSRTTADTEPPVPHVDATERERDAAAMAWLAWDYRRRLRGESTAT